MNLLKEHMDILERLTEKASKEKEFNERGQFMNLQKLVREEISIIEHIKDCELFKDKEKIECKPKEETYISSNMIKACNHPIRHDEKNLKTIISIEPSFDYNYVMKCKIDISNHNILFFETYKYDYKDIESLTDIIEESDATYIDLCGIGKVVYDQLDTLCEEDYNIVGYIPTRELKQSFYLETKCTLTFHEFTTFYDFYKAELCTELYDICDKMEVVIKDGYISLIEQRGVDRSLFDCFVSLIYYAKNYKEEI